METLEDLKKYFEMTSQKPGGVQYEKGLKLTEELIKLKQKSSITQEAFDRFLFELEDLPGGPGSGYFDLWIRTRHFGYNMGLEVPITHPWNKEHENETLCVAEDAFPENLTKGVWYKVVDCTSKKGFIRVIDDKNHFRWFPENVSKKRSLLSGRK